MQAAVLGADGGKGFTGMPGVPNGGSLCSAAESDPGLGRQVANGKSAVPCSMLKTQKPHLPEVCGGEDGYEYEICDIQHTVRLRF